MLSRLGRDDRKLDGRLKVRISGKLARKDATYDLEQLSPELGKTGLSISSGISSRSQKGRFAELELPKNFIPKLIDVRAELNGQSKPLQRRFDWPKQ